MWRRPSLALRSRSDTLRMPRSRTQPHTARAEADTREAADATGRFRPMQVSHIDTVFLWVGDLDRAVAWYRDRLGIEPGPRYGAWQSMALAGETVFALHQGPGGHRLNDSFSCVIFVK